jgi:cobalt-precorrin-7 (C5)-methyltransferase
MTNREKAQKISIIGCGPGGKDDITVRALKKIYDCDIIIGSPRMLATFAPQNRVSLNFTGKIERLREIINSYYGKKIGILVTGDTGIYSLAQKIIDLSERWDIEVIAGLSSLQVAFARIQETWEGVETFSFHGRKLVEPEKLRESKKAVIFCDRDNNACVILRWLFPLGLDRRCYIAQNLTLEEEKIIEVKSLDEIEHVLPVSYELLILIK